MLVIWITRVFGEPCEKYDGAREITDYWRRKIYRVRRRKRKERTENETETVGMDLTVNVKGEYLLLRQKGFSLSLTQTLAPSHPLIRKGEMTHRRALWCHN